MEFSHIPFVMHYKMISVSRNHDIHIFSIHKTLQPWIIAQELTIKLVEKRRHSAEGNHLAASSQHMILKLRDSINKYGQIWSIRCVTVVYNPWSVFKISCISIPRLNFKANACRVSHFGSHIFFVILVKHFWIQQFQSKLWVKINISHMIPKAMTILYNLLLWFNVALGFNLCSHYRNSASLRIPDLAWQYSVNEYNSDSRTFTSWYWVRSCQILSQRFHISFSFSRTRFQLSSWAVSQWKDCWGYSNWKHT